MRFSCVVSELASALAAVKPALAKNPTLVAYSGVLMTVKGSRVMLSASDEELTITFKMNATATEDGTALLVPKALNAYLTGLRSDCPLDVATNETGLLVSAGGAPAYHFRSLHSTFPLPSFNAANLSPVDSASLSSAAAAIAPCSDGLVQVVGGDTVVLRTTDRYRIAVADVAGAQLNAGQVVLKLSSLQTLARSGISQFGVDSKGIRLRAAGERVMVSVRLNTSVYHDLDKPLAREPGPVATFDRASLLAATGRLVTLADKTPLRVSVTERAAVLSVANADLGSGSETVAGTSREPFSFLVNAEFLHDALDSIATESVSFGWTTPNQAIFVRADDGSVLHVLMPLAPSAPYTSR